MRRAPRLLGPLALFALNAYFCKELFTAEYTRHMGSIEAAYISISRLMMNHWGDLSWFPEWYGGIPQQNSYPPFLHFIAAVAASIARISPALAHHAVSAFFYCLGPVTLYFLAVRLSNSRLASFLTGLVYSLIAPSALLAREVRADLGGPFLPRRLQALVVYGEGPHIASLALLPLALIAFDRALSSRKPLDVLAAAVALAAVVLTNWLGAFALAAAVLCLFLARAERASLLRPVGIAALAYLLAAPWIPPSTIRTIQSNASSVGGDFSHVYEHLPAYALIGLPAFAILKFLLHRAKASTALQFFALFSALIAGVALSAYWFHLDLLPQPKRYHLEMDLALCGLLTGVAKFPRRAVVAVSILTVCLLTPQVWRYRRYGRNLIQTIDVRNTTEYKVANWMDAHAKGERIFVGGTASYWLNAFTDTQQMEGGFDQAKPNPEFSTATYLIYSGGGPTDLWLRAFGVSLIAVAGPSSPFQNIERFASWKELWREGDTVIYAVPAASRSLAAVVPASAWIRRADEITNFVNALKDPQPTLEWTSRHSARIAADVPAGSVVAVRETWHAGWHAEVNGHARRVFPDALGLMIIEPQCTGPCMVNLFYDGGTEMALAKLACGASLMGCVIWWLFDGRRKQRS